MSRAPSISRPLRDGWETDTLGQSVSRKPGGETDTLNQPISSKANRYRLSNILTTSAMGSPITLK